MNDRPTYAEIEAVLHDETHSEDDITLAFHNALWTHIATKPMFQDAALWKAADPKEFRTYREAAQRFMKHLKSKGMLR